jgi:hypothetical protein
MRFLPVIVITMLAACRSREPKAVAIPSQPAVLAVASAQPEGGGILHEEPREAAPFIAGTERCGWVDPANVSRECVDDGPAPACRDAEPCLTCAALQHYKPRVAARALACTRRLPVRDGCSSCAVLGCIDEARKSACDDATATEACAKIGFKCRAVGMSECRLYLSGMAESGRTKMIECLTTPAGCGVGLHDCAEKI